MTRAEFLTAAAKGQGRVLAALRSGEYRASLHDLRRLVLRWPGIDSQCESSRGWYTAELMRSSGYEPVLTQLVIAHLARTKGAGCHRSHRTATVAELARRGNGQAKAALYANYDAADDFRFAREIIGVDGLAGLEWIISHSTSALTEENAWQFRWWIEDLGEEIGSDTVSEWLAREAGSRPEVAEFARLVATEQPRQKVDPPAPITYEELREQWARPMAERKSALIWARTASEAEIRKAWRAFEVEEDPEWVHKLALALRRKTQFCDIDRTIELALACERNRNPYIWVLEAIKDQRIRQVGFDLVATGRLAYGIALISKYARPGDESILLASAEKLTDEWEIHWAGLDLMNLGKEMDLREILLWVCEMTPCSFCRESGLRQLIERGQAPESLLRECLLDADSEARTGAEAALNRASAPQP